jgi:hypothetical protein
LLGATGWRQRDLRKRKNLLLWRFQDGALVADMAFSRDARRVVVSFSDLFNTCSVKVIYRKKGGAEPIIYQGKYPDTSEYEAIDQKMISTSCLVQEGNIFGGAQ